MDTSTDLLSGPEFDAIIDAICREADTDETIAELLDLLAA